MSDIRELKGAISLIAKFNTEEDDNQIDSIICHAINAGLHIEAYADDDYMLQDVI